MTESTSADVPAGPFEGPDLEEAVESFDVERFIFQSGGLLVVDKPAGLPVHQGTRHPYGLAELLTEWAAVHPGVLEIRPGNPVHPLHRLDREASGVLLLGLSTPVRKKVQAAFAARRVTKRYLTLVGGPVDETGQIRGKVRSKLRGEYRLMKASLDYRRLWGDERMSLLEVRPAEGYTHQIRSLLAGAGRPIVGDLRYGKPGPARKFLAKFGLDYLPLHAFELELPPVLKGPARRFRAELPPSFLRVFEQKEWEVSEIERRLELPL